MRKSIVKEVLIAICKLLYEEKYEIVSLNDLDDRVSALELRKAVNEYRGNLVLPTEGAFNNYEDYYEDGDARGIVEFDLWFDNQKSDLTLRIDIDTEGKYSILDIKVL